jgi:hypothetical protein
MQRPRHSASDHPSSVQLAPAARALTKDPVATSISYLFFIRVCLLAMPPDIAGPHPWPDKFVPRDFRDGFDQIPSFTGTLLRTNSMALSGSYARKFRTVRGFPSESKVVARMFHPAGIVSPNCCTPRAIVTQN